MKRFDLFDKLQIASVFLVSIVLLVVTNYSEIIHRLFSHDPASLDYLYQQLAAIPEKIPSWLYDFLFSPSLATMVLWALIGFLAYSVVVFFETEASTVYERISIAFLYSHPKRFKQESYWLHNLIELLLTLAMIILLVGWLWLVVKYFIPYSSLLVLFGLYSSNTLIEALFNFGLAYLVVSYALIVLVFIFSLFRLIKRRLG